MPLAPRQDLVLIDGSDFHQIAVLKALLSRLVYVGVYDPVVRKTAQDVTMHCASRDYVCEAATVQSWVRSHVRYRRDVRGVESFATPRVLLTEYTDEYEAPADHDGYTGAGDCDDHAALVASMMISLGHEARIHLVDANGGGVLNHAVTAVRLPKTDRRFGNKWVFMETTIDEYEGRPVGLGWVPPKATILDEFVDLDLKRLGDTPGALRDLRKITNAEFRRAPQEDDDAIRVLMAR